MRFFIATGWRRLIVFVLASLPFCWIFYQAYTQQLGADPAKTIVLFTGQWAFYCLLISLAVSPLKRLLGWSWLMSHRRMLGLFALFYALLHLLAYLVFILGLNFSELLSEIIKRPYITVGAPALLILIALGVTSTQGMMRRLGKNWVRLHRLVYWAALLAWVHVFWQVRASYFDALLFGVLTLAVLLPRLFWWAKKRKAVPGR